MLKYHLNLSVPNISVEVDESTFFETVNSVDNTSCYHVEKVSSYFFENDIKHNLSVFNALDLYGESLGTFAVIHEVLNDET